MVDRDGLPYVQSVSPFDFVNAEQLSGDGIRIEPQPYCLKLGIRGSLSDSTFVKTVEKIGGLALPREANTVTHGEASSLLWLGPDEWQWRLTADHDESAEALLLRFRAALKGVRSSVVDLSDYYSVIRLEGERVFEVLAKGSPLDTRSALADAAKCAQTRFGHASVLLNRSDRGVNPLSVDVQVRWSFAEYLWLFFTEAVLEFQED